MFVQTEQTPNPNTLKFLPGKKVSEIGSIEFVKVELQGSCSGCPSSIMTLKQGMQNLLCHYVPEVKTVEATQD